jgi:hypothetical protein
VGGYKPRRPRLLDLFCKAGGASMGYHRAGFEVVGVDMEPQPRYPFEFHQADALTFPLGGFDVVAASPPCQIHTSLKPLAKATAKRMLNYLDLIPPTRERLIAWGGPYVIENVPGSTLRGHFVLCGSSFGLRVRRHRWFESNLPVLVPPCAHNAYPKDRPVGLGDARAYHPERPGYSMRLSRFVAVYGSTRYAGEDRDRREAWASTG